MSNTRFFKLILPIVLLASLRASALYNGNPAEPRLIENGVIWKKNKLKVKVGYEGDFMYDRNVRAHGKAECSVDRFKYWMNQGVATLTIKRRFEIYGSLGTMKTGFEHLHSKHHLTWGAGARGIVYRKRTTVIGIDAVYQRAEGRTLKYQDWQAGLGIAHQIDVLTPYLALTFSGMRGKVTKVPQTLDLRTGSFTLRNRHWFGFALGCSVSPGKWFDVNVEARVLDEQAFSLAGNFAF
ncbi:MAG TPA: hypothetical protein VLG49_04820 [Rhabdochlamydiaceae bacterium]|nr:hypothetical protein [Rhabdochlamydiaceae bacterium]